MRVLAKVRTAAGGPAAGRKATWWVTNKAGGFEPRSEAVVRPDGTLDMAVTSASFGAHLRLDDGMVAAYPVRMSSTVLDLGELVLLDPPRQGIRAVSAGAFVASAPPAEPARPPTVVSPIPVTVDLGTRLKSTGQQIEAVRADLRSVSLTQVRVKWSEPTANGVAETEAQFVEQPVKGQEGSTPPTAPERTVPDFRGLTPAAAQRQAAAAGLRVEVTPIFVAEPERHGRVLRQVPEAGARDNTTTVRLYVGRTTES